MANEYDLPDDLLAAQQQLNRQQKMAEMLMAQGQQQPQGQMISGRYVAPSFFQQLQPVANMLTGAYLSSKGDEKSSELAKQLRQLGATETQDILKAARGAPARSEELAGPAYQGVAPSIQYAATAANPDEALRLALMARSPQAKALAVPLMQNALPKKTDKLIEYDTYKAEGGKLPFSEWTNRITPAEQARLDLDRQRLGLEGARYQLDKSMKEFEMGGGKLNDEQGKAVGFGTRAKEASAILNKLESEGVKDIGKTRATIGGIVGATPLIGEKLEQGVISASNMLPSALGGPNEAQQSTLQARKNFATAVLRKESGASISPTEFADVERIYFAAPGDSDAIVKQKQRSRELAIKALETQAGPGARFIKEFQPQTDFSGEAGGWRLK